MKNTIKKFDDFEYNKGMLSDFLDGAVDFVTDGDDPQKLKDRALEGWPDRKEEIDHVFDVLEKLLNVGTANDDFGGYDKDSRRKMLEDIIKRSIDKVRENDKSK